MSFPIRSDSLRPLLSRVHADPYGNLFSENTGPRLHKALSPRYVWSKLAVILYEKRHPRHPWINRRAIDLLGGHLRPVHRGFEWGSGVGTCWLARRSRRIRLGKKFRRANPLRRQHGLLTNDSLLLAAAEVFGITSIATSDADFDVIPWLNVYRPTDLP